MADCLSRPYEAAVTLLHETVVEKNALEMLAIRDTMMYSSLAMIKKHNLNSTDAVLLTALLDFARSDDAPACVMVSADKRLLRAAQAEGLPILDPETVSAAEAATLLAPL